MNIRPLYLWFSVIFLLLAFSGLFYQAMFTRYYADDFCMAGDVRYLGLIEMLAKWYNSWTGRFMFILGTGLFGLAGIEFAGWLPVIVGTTWLLGLWWFAYPLFKRLGWTHPRLLGLVAACLALVVLLFSIPNLFQSFFWQNGMVNYSLPLVGLTYVGGILVRVWSERIRPLPASMALFVLAFVSGGFTESFSAMQVTFFVLLIFALLFVGNRPTRTLLLPVLCVALLGGLVAMFVVIISPGNAIRLQFAGVQGDHPGIIRIVTFSLRNMVHIFGKYFIQTPFWALTSILPLFFAGWLFGGLGERPVSRWTIQSLWKQSWLKGIVFVLGSALVLVTASCAPVVFAMNAYPDDRTIIVPQFVIVLASIGVSTMLGFGLRRIGWLPDPEKKKLYAATLQVGILGVVLVAAGVSVWQSSQKIPALRSNAHKWDQMDAILQQAVLEGQSEVTVTAFDAPFGLANVGTDPNDWVNKCMADYYGIEQIIGK